jgi:tryptophanyl-tRNA synthetase
LYSNFATAQEIEAMKKRYLSGIGWGEAKAELFQVINREVAPMREKYEHLMANKNIIDEHLTAGAEKARAIAKVTMARLREKVLGK